MVGFFMFVIALSLAILVLVGGLQWVGDRRRSVEGAGGSPAQLERMESALSALESRVDDLQEQQRFLERLVAERPERGSLPRGGEDSDSDGSRSILFDTEPSEEDR